MWDHIIRFIEHEFIGILIFIMASLIHNQIELSATNVRFDQNEFIITLSNKQKVTLHFEQTNWLKWLADATKQQRENWSLKPGGYAIYWEDLDDGIEVCHLLDEQL